MPTVLRIIVGASGSPCNLRALRYAQHLARDYNATLVPVLAWLPPCGDLADRRIHKAWWNELYQGYPVRSDYVEQSNVTMAARLEGHLLIEHGDIDDNVHPAGTMRFVDALIKANKSFDMLFIPKMAHGERNNYLARRRWDYFVQHLLGVEPPHNFEVKAAEQ